MATSGFKFSGGTSFSGDTSFNGSSWAGKTFTIGGGSVSNASTGSKLTMPDKIVKPGLSDEVLQRLALMRPPVEPGPAEIRWGKPAKFQITDPVQPTQPTYTSVTVITGGSSSSPTTPDDAQLFVYDEVWRQEDSVRVENPADAEQYVMVARCTTVVFRNREEGFFIQLNFQNPERG